MIGIREFSELLAQDCFNNPFSPDRETPAKNIPPLDEVDDGDIVSTFLAINFSGCIYPSAAVRNISDMTLNSASSVSIVSQHTDEKEEDKQGGIHNRLVTRLPKIGSLVTGL